MGWDGSGFVFSLVPALSCLPIDDAPMQLVISELDEGLRAVGRGTS